MEVECPLPVLFLTTLVLTGTGSQRSERWKRHDGELLLKVVRADGLMAPKIPIELPTLAVPCVLMTADLAVNTL